MELAISYFRSTYKLARCASVVAVGFLLIACEEEKIVTKAEVIRPAITMVVADVERIRKDTYPGRAKATRQVNIGFEVSGKMAERRVNVGDEVEEGTVLGVLEPGRYEAEISRLEGEKAALNAELANTGTELKRRKFLLKKGHVAQSRVDNQVMVVDAVRAKIKAVNAAIKRASIDLDYTVLKAPFGGTISETFVENFQNVVAKQPVFRLLDTSQIEMEVSVPEDLIGMAPYVKSIKVTFGTLPDVEIPAKIKEISNEASMTTRTYPVTLLLTPPAGAGVKPGMAGHATAEVELPDNILDRGISIPAGAVFSPDKAKPEEAFVWLVDDQRLTVAEKAVDVVGLSNRGLLVTGLDPGTRIVIAGVSYLSSGQKILLQAE